MKQNGGTTGAQDRNPEERGPSQLFLLRVWPDDEPGENDWHGRVQHAVTCEAHPFRSCAELRRLIRDMMAPKPDQFADEV